MDHVTTLSLVLNVIFGIALIVLYVLHFSSSRTTNNEIVELNDTLKREKKIVIPPQSIRDSKIVYINSDILNDQYEMVKDLMASATAKQGRLEANYKVKAEKLQQDYEDFQQKAGSGLLSENQTNAAQEDMMKRKDELDQMEGQLQILMDEIQKDNEQVRKNVVDYVKEYNKSSNYNYIITYTSGPGGVVLLANDSLDITSEILAGLNSQYRTNKKK